MRMVGHEIHQLGHVLWKFIGVRSQVAAQRAGRHLVRAWSAAQAQVDAAGVQRFQRAKLLGNDQR